MTALAISFLAGLLTCLSPCVFPVLPLIVGSSLQKNKLGPLCVAAGMIFSFVAIGALLMSTGTAFGFSPSLFRKLASVLLIVAGLFLLSKRLQDFSSRLLSPIAAKTEKTLQKTDTGSLVGQAITGALLGLLWSPCTGPTMGATLALGARDGPSLQIVASMFFFGLGAAVPMLVIAYGAKSLLSKGGPALSKFASAGKTIFGVCMLVIGIATFFGVDKRIEAFALDHLPERIVELSIKY